MAALILRHWQEFRPQMCQALQAKGKLLPSVEAAAQLTAEAVSELRSKGVPYNQAWESIREEWALLPSEREKPNLSFDPETLPEKLPAATGASVNPTK
jgi:hypothetical protein